MILRASMLAAAALALMPLTAQAQDAASTSTPAGPLEKTRVDAARTLIDLLNIEQTLDFMFEKLAPTFAQGVIGAMQGEPEAAHAVDELIQKGHGGQPRLVAILSDEFLIAIRAQYPALKTRMAFEYASAFTLEELRELTAFYRTGAGAKSLKLLPELQLKMSAAGQELGRVAGMAAGEKAFERAAREMLPAKGKPKT